MIQNPVFRGFNPDPVYAAAAMIIMWRYHHLNGFRTTGLSFKGS